MDESLNTIDQKRLMVFTSLVRLMGIVSHARITQLHKAFVDYLKENPSDTYDSPNDHGKMKLFLEKRFPIQTISKGKMK